MIIGTLMMPCLGETMEEGKIINWLVKAGEKFERGQIILEVETDKTVVEFPALGAGTLVEILVDSDEVIPVGNPICKVAVAEGIPDWTATDISQKEPDSNIATQVKNSLGATDNRSVEANVKASSSFVEGRVRATPAARLLARKNKISLETINGTGRRKRIEVADVTGAINNDADLLGVKTAHDIAYAEIGSAGGEDFLLIHGYSSDHKTFAGLANQLKKAGHRAVCIDLPAHGATIIEAEEVADLSINLKDFSNAVFGLKPIHLVAHSLGVLPAIKLAESIEVSSLTLIAPAGIGTSIDSDFVQVMAAPNSQAQVNHMLRRLSVVPLALSAKMIEDLYEELSKGRLTNLAKDFVGEQGQTIDIVPALEALSHKTSVKVIVGHHDQITKWQDALTLPALVAVHHFKGSGHMPHWDQQSEVSAILTRDIR